MRDNIIRKISRLFLIPLYIYRDHKRIKEIEKDISAVKEGLKKITEELRRWKSSENNAVECMENVVSSGVKVSVNKNKQNMYCPICENYFESFNPFDGMTYRENARCPVCSSLERHRLLGYFFKKEFKLSGGEKILHIAPEFCFYEMYRDSTMKKGGEYVCGDIEVQKYPYAREIRKMDITQIDFPDNYFDIIHCCEVLEHIEDDITAMKEIFRCLKREGLAVFTVPRNDKLVNIYEDFSITKLDEREKHFGQRDHVRWYTTTGFIERLTSCGFKVNDYGAKDILNRYDIERSSILLSDKIFVCSKI